MLESSLDNDIQDPGSLLGHATPAILVDCLPADQLAAILEGALASGAMTAEHVVSTVGTTGLASALPDDVIWASLASAADGAGLTGEQPATGYSRTFLVAALDGGFDAGELTAEDVLRHATPSILTQNLPAAQSARLLEASLAAGSMNPKLVLETLSIAVLVEHLPAGILWGCIAEQAGAEAPAFDDPATEAVEAVAEPEIVPEILAPAEEPEAPEDELEAQLQAAALDLELDAATADESSDEEDEDEDDDLLLDGDDLELELEDDEDESGTKRPSRIRAGSALGKSSIAAARFRSRKSK